MYRGVEIASLLRALRNAASKLEFLSNIQRFISVSATVHLNIKRKILWMEPLYNVAKHL